MVPWPEHDMTPCIVVLYHMRCCIPSSFFKETSLICLYCNVVCQMQKNNLVKNTVLTVKLDSLPFALS